MVLLKEQLKIFEEPHDYDTGNCPTVMDVRFGVGHLRAVLDVHNNRIEKFGKNSNRIFEYNGR
jgi:hypothetical protein